MSTLTERFEATEATSVDCIGLRGPEPILTTARAARELAATGGLLEIQADEPAFPIDLKSWCRSTSAELLSIEERDHAFRALVRVARNNGPPSSRSAWGSVRPGSSAVPRTPAPPPVRTPVPPPSYSGLRITEPVTPGAVLLDYRGRRCPEPIVELAKAARQAQGPLEVIADDPAFPLDLKSWCRSSGAASEAISSPAGLFRVIVYPKGVSRTGLKATLVPGAPISDAPLAGRSAPPEPAQAPPAQSQPAQSQPAASQPAHQDTMPPAQVQLIAPAAATASAAPAKPEFTFAAGTPTAKLDMRTLPADALEDELEQIGRLRQGTGVTLFVPEGSDQRALKWCTANGHELRSYAGDGRIDLVLGKRAAIQPEVAPAPATTTAIVPAEKEGEYDCALLVMHNDLECLLGAMLVANSAAAQGMRTMVFFTFWGLNLLRGDRPNLNAPKQSASFMQTMFKWMMPKGPKRQGLGQLNFGGMGASIMGGIMQKKNIQDLPKLIKSAREQNVRFIACTMSMEVMGISQRELEPYENLEFGGVATFVEAGRHAPLTLVF